MLLNANRYDNVVFVSMLCIAAALVTNFIITDGSFDNVVFVSNAFNCLAPS